MVMVMNTGRPKPHVRTIGVPSAECAQSSTRSQHVEALEAVHFFHHLTCSAPWVDLIGAFSTWLISGFMLIIPCDNMMVVLSNMSIARKHHSMTPEVIDPMENQRGKLWRFRLTSFTGLRRTRATFL